MKHKIAVRNTGSDADVNFGTFVIGNRYDGRIKRMNALQNNKFAVFSDEIFFAEKAVVLLKIKAGKPYGFAIYYALQLLVEKHRVNSFG